MQGQVHLMNYYRFEGLSQEAQNLIVMKRRYYLIAPWGARLTGGLLLKDDIQSGSSIFIALRVSA